MTTVAPWLIGASRPPPPARDPRLGVARDLLARVGDGDRRDPRTERYAAACAHLAEALLARLSGGDPRPPLETLARWAEGRARAALLPDVRLCLHLGARLAGDVRAEGIAGHLEEAARAESIVGPATPEGNNNLLLSVLLDVALPPGRAVPGWSLEECARRWRLDGGIWIDFPRFGRDAHGRFTAPLSYQGRFATVLAVGYGLGLETCRPLLAGLVETVEPFALADGTCGWHGRSHESLYGYVGIRLACAVLRASGGSSAADRLAARLDRRLADAFLLPGRPRLFPVEGAPGRAVDAYVRTGEYAAYAALHLAWMAVLEAGLRPPAGETAPGPSVSLSESGFFRLAAGGFEVAGSTAVPVRWDPATGPFPVILYAPHSILVGRRPGADGRPLPWIPAPPFAGNRRWAAEAGGVAASAAGFLPDLRLDGGTGGEAVEWADAEKVRLEADGQRAALSIRGRLTRLRLRKAPLPVRFGVDLLRRVSGRRLDLPAGETIGLVEAPAGTFDRRIALGPSGLEIDDRWRLDGARASGWAATLRLAPGGADLPGADESRLLGAEGDVRILRARPVRGADAGRAATRLGPTGGTVEA